MDINTEYFVSLLSSHINKTTPPTSDNIDWNKVYKLADINDVTAIISTQINLLPKEYRPTGAILSYFKQTLGMTIIDYDDKMRALNEVKSVLNENKIDYILVKGTILRDMYPQKELRTSGDIDFIIRQEQIDECRHIFEKELTIEQNASSHFSFNKNGQDIEFHSNLDCDNEYFNDIFNMCSKNGSEYKLNDTTHLLYIINHIAKHFKYSGAGIRMFMDIDVLIRHMNEFEYEDFIKECERLNIASFAKACFSLCNFWFNTPVKAELTFNANDSFASSFMNTIINGGSFGFEERNGSSYYTTQTKKSGFLGLLLSLLHFLFPKIKNLKDSYPYCEKAPILIPIAWFNRIFDGIFKRGSHSIKTIKGIVNSNDDEYRKLLKELEL